MFVVFEGIDGSGKTTVSNKVAKKLRKRGISVEHVREDGEFASDLVRRMREFGKDTRNLSMAPLTELLFYCAREAQMLAECVRPALQKDADIVFADRYLYSYEVLAHNGRGLERETIRPILDSVAGGIWPDLVVLMDVDPHVARARRKVRKINKKSTAPNTPSGGGSRKGLGGVGVQHRLRHGYRELAARESSKWLVLDNADPRIDLASIVRQIVFAIESLYHGKVAEQVIADVINSGPVRSAPPTLPPFAIDDHPGAFSAGKRAYYRALEERAASEPHVSAYWLSGMDDDEAYQLREKLLPDAPAIIAHGLRGLGSERAWLLRERLAVTEAYLVARSLDGVRVEGPRAQAMREHFVESQPQAVLATLDGNDSGAAWAIRDQLSREYPREVVTSTKGLDSGRAWRVREEFLAVNGGLDGLQDAQMAAAIADSLRRVGNERAWELRRACMAAAPTATLWSLVGLDDDESWRMREKYAARAGKIVLRTFDGNDSRRAWELRKRYAKLVKETLDSMSGLDGDTAWSIRDECAHVWPSTTVKSLGQLALTERGGKMAIHLLSRYPGNISLLKHITRIATEQISQRDEP